MAIASAVKIEALFVILNFCFKFNFEEYIAAPVKLFFGIFEPSV